MLPAQDPDRPARPHPHAQGGRRALRLHPARRERVRPVRGRAFVDLDLGGPRLRGGARPRGAGRRRRRLRDRRRRDVGGHGLRGDEQRRPHEGAADRRPQRQRDVDRATGRRDVEVPVAALRRRALPGPAGRRQGRGAAAAAAAPGGGAAGARAGQGHGDRRHAVRGARLLLCRADRRPRRRAAGGDPEGGEGARHRPGLDPRAHPQGQGLPAGRGLGRQVPRRREVRRGDRRAAEEALERAVLHQGLRAAR